MATVGTLLVEGELGVNILKLYYASLSLFFSFRTQMRLLRVSCLKKIKLHLKRSIKNNESGRASLIPCAPQASKSIFGQLQISRVKVTVRSPTLTKIINKNLFILTTTTIYYAHNDNTRSYWRLSRSTHFAYNVLGSNVLQCRDSANKHLFGPSFSKIFCYIAFLIFKWLYKLSACYIAVECIAWLYSKQSYYFAMCIFCCGV